MVAPFNAHVAALRRVLPTGVRAGTVDKFQGREAPVAIYSMATSTAEDSPRGIDFLYSLNRLNVAVSRARGLAVLVCSPGLLAPRLIHVRHVPLVSALCSLPEHARGHVDSVGPLDQRRDAHERDAGTPPAPPTDEQVA